MTYAILLINTNVARPPVSPVGLEYIGETLIDAGVSVQVLDFCFESDWKASLQRQLKNAEPLAVGLSVRNTDDCSFVSRKSFLPWIDDVVVELKSLTGAPVFLGSAGFSTMPEAVLRVIQADGGIEGDGEEALLALAKCLMKGEDVTHLPNMVYRRNRDVVRNPRVDVDLRYLPKPRRRIFDNRRYEQLCRFGIAAGVRVYPHTPLAEAIVDGSIRGGLHPDAREAPHQPVFYLSPLLDDDAFALIHQLVNGDPRFLILSTPAETGSYNYADAKVLCQLIEKGARGAYWDIIRWSQRY